MQDLNVKLEKVHIIQIMQLIGLTGSVDAEGDKGKFIGLTGSVDAGGDKGKFIGLTGSVDAEGDN